MSLENERERERSRVSGLHLSCPLAAAVRSLQLSVRCCPVRRNGVDLLVRWKCLPSLWGAGQPLPRLELRTIL